MFWCFGFLVFWFFGIWCFWFLGFWFFGVVFWYFGILVFWYFGLLGFRVFGRAACHHVRGLTASKSLAASFWLFECLAAASRGQRIDGKLPRIAAARHPKS